MERRCVATGNVADPARMIRFVAAPDGAVIADIAGKLPGRGAWLTASRACADQAEAKKLLQRRLSAGRKDGPPLTLAPGLADRLEAQLAASALNLLGLAKRAGLVTLGFEKVQSALKTDRIAVLLAACDGAPDGRRKLARLAGERPLIESFSGQELSLALGRENVIHAALADGGLTLRVLSEVAKLAGFRTPAASPMAPVQGE